MMLLTQTHSLFCAAYFWIGIVDKVMNFARNNNPLFVGFAFLGFIAFIFISYNITRYFIRNYLHVILFVPAALFVPACAYLIYKSVINGLIYSYQWQFVIWAIIVSLLFLKLLYDASKTLEPGVNTPFRNLFILMGLVGILLTNLIIEIETDQNMLIYLKDVLMDFWYLALAMLSR
jgi:hypothetical protein